MKTFQEFILEGGASAGKLEIVNTSLEKAIAYAEPKFAKHKRVLYNEMPDHDKNYQIAQSAAAMGHTKRKDMPVIEASDIKALQTALKQGGIDLNPPYAAATDQRDPFPEGLSGKDADLFLSRGLRINDGSKPDDQVTINKRRVLVTNLVPIQQQIYYDKSIDTLAQFGAKASRKFHQSTIWIVSSDLKIIDGHHRFLSAILVDPNQKVQVLMIDLPLSKLLPLTKAFGDARGNKRNA
jgi:hypothetical protein